MHGNKGKDLHIRANVDYGCLLYLLRSAMLHGHGNVEMDTTRGKFLKIHTIRVSDTCVRHVLDTTRLR